LQIVKKITNSIQEMALASALQKFHTNFPIKVIMVVNLSTVIGTILRHKLQRNKKIIQPPPQKLGSKEKITLGPQ
jgi:hypothetical protein